MLMLCPLEMSVQPQEVVVEDSNLAKFEGGYQDLHRPQMSENSFLQFALLEAMQLAWFEFAA